MRGEGKINECKVSVIIPTYNRAKIIPSLLESWQKVHEVTACSYEIIFSDDGSADNTIQILETFQTSLPIKIIKNNHGGAAKARNSAIKAASGEKLLIIGDDIYPNPQLINQHYTKLCSLGDNFAILGCVDWHPDLSVNHLMHHITEVGNEQFSFNRFTPNAITDFRHFYTCNISMDRKFLLQEKVIFDDAFSKCNYEDIELGYRLEKRGLQIYYFPEAFGYHYHPYNLPGFCTRMQTAGEMAIVFESLHPEVSNIIGVDQTVKLYNSMKKFAFIARFINFNQIMLKITRNCDKLEVEITRVQDEDMKNTMKCRLSKEYSKLFTLYYRIGILQAKQPTSKLIRELMYLGGYGEQFLLPLRVVDNGFRALLKYLFSEKLNRITSDPSYKLIKKSGLFVKHYYLMQNIDVAKSKMDPLRHFIEFGGKEGRNPSLKFDTQYYMESNPDVRDSGMNPLVHYIRFGQYEGRKISQPK